MSVRQSVTRSLLCSGCRTHVLHSFMSAAGVSPTAASKTAAVAAPSWQQPRQSRRFSTQPSRLSATETGSGAVESDSGDGDSSPSSSSSPSPQGETAAAPPPPPRPSANEAAVPWYLQVDPPVAEQPHALTERQRLPHLPEHSPDLLQPLLEHVSKELGIDDLSLLDLRPLDPPPALGANLLMIIGTARSEKHLHVSADRLCRWLRSAHGLTPLADGLLGRNELKLKMRRKAKRSRLLSAVGAKDTGSGEVDDGIRTGWVCVNVGRVAGGVLPEQHIKAAQKIENFVGFGSQSSTCSIVVQMMTDEKRGQLDLETLWNGILRRNEQARLDQKGPAEDGNRLSESESLSESTEVYRPAMAQSAGRHASGPRIQARAFHSSILRQLPTQSSFDNIKGALQTGTPAKHEIKSDHTPANRTRQAELTLRRLLDGLKAMDPEVALEALGKGRNDTATTPFLRAFYSAMPDFPDASHWHMHLELRCHAVHLGHVHYSPGCLISELHSMRLACVMPSEETYMMVFETLLAPLLEPSAAVRQPALYKKTISFALDVLDNMHEDGHDPVSEPILRLLYQTTALPPLPSYPTQQLSQEHPQPSNQAIPVTPTSLADLLPSLSAHALTTAAASASTSSWLAASSLWRSHPQQFRSRPALLYTALLKSAAQTNSQRIAIDTLRTTLPAMPQEEPAVKLGGDLALAMKECLHVAEPRAQEMGEQGGRGEWAILWRRLVRAIGAK